MPHNQRLFYLPVRYLLDFSKSSPFQHFAYAKKKICSHFSRSKFKTYMHYSIMLMKFQRKKHPTSIRQLELKADVQARIREYNGVHIRTHRAPSTLCCGCAQQVAYSPPGRRFRTYFWCVCELEAVSYSALDFRALLPQNKSLQIPYKPDRIFFGFDFGTWATFFFSFQVISFLEDNHFKKFNCN